MTAIQLKSKLLQSRAAKLASGGIAGLLASIWLGAALFRFFDGVFALAGLLTMLVGVGLSVFALIGAVDAFEKNK